MPFNGSSRPQALPTKQSLSPIRAKLTSSRSVDPSSFECHMTFFPRKKNNSCSKPAWTPREPRRFTRITRTCNYAWIHVGFRVWASHAGPKPCHLGVAPLNALLGFRTLGPLQIRSTPVRMDQRASGVAQLTGQFLCKDANKPHCGHHMRHPTGDLSVHSSHSYILEGSGSNI